MRPWRLSDSRISTHFDCDLILLSYANLSLQDHPVHAWNVSRSLLTTVGVTEFIAQSPDQVNDL